MSTRRPRWDPSEDAQNYSEKFEGDDSSNDSSSSTPSADDNIESLLSDDDGFEDDEDIADDETLHEEKVEAIAKKIMREMRQSRGEGSTCAEHADLDLWRIELEPYSWQVLYVPFSLFPHITNLSLLDHAGCRSESHQASSQPGPSQREPKQVRQQPTGENG